MGFTTCYSDNKLTTSVCNRVFVYTCWLLWTIANGQYLTASNGHLELNGEKIFLSGMNIAWHNYGNDFGNGQYACCSRIKLQDYLQRISAAGGNSIRIWLHTEYLHTPEFDADGFVNGTDADDTLISDLSSFLDDACSRNVIVFIVLWNGASYSQLTGLVLDDAKLQSYINRVLKPMVNALKDKVALGGYEIINKPEGLIQVGRSDYVNPCYDTQSLQCCAGWLNTSRPISMQKMLSFINRQAAAVKSIDSQALVTIGSWSERSATNSFDFFNYYSDECLICAGGEQQGTLDIYQIHSHSSKGVYSLTTPMNKACGDYGLEKPLIVGEFSQASGDGRTIETQLNHIYYTGYSGAWSWQANGVSLTRISADDFATQARGLSYLRDHINRSYGGQIDLAGRLCCRCNKTMLAATIRTTSTATTPTSTAKITVQRNTFTVRTSDNGPSTASDIKQATSASVINAAQADDNQFKSATIGLGVVASILFLVLVVVIILYCRTRLKEQAPPVSSTLFKFQPAPVHDD